MRIAGLLDIGRNRPPTGVDVFWSQHTVNSTPFESAEDSESYLQWRNAQYPLFPEFMETWGSHDGEVVLDYGCGPGNDVVGFLLYSGAANVIGMDVSAKALALAEHRIKLHRFNPKRWRLIRTSDADPRLPLRDDSVDYINCGGVLHHTSRPQTILAEFRRILKSNGRGRIMVYNRQSLWFHLYVAYMRMIVDGLFPGSTVEEAFRRSTDGEDCPISIAYSPERFVACLADANLDGKFIGGYLSTFELKCWREHGQAAINDDRLGDEHRTFLTELVFGADGFPTWHGKHAGIGGSYRFAKDRA